MKHLFILTAIIFSFSAFSQRSCFIEVFGNEYEGEGRTFTEAKLRARVSCSRNHDPMFCGIDKAICMSDPDPMNFYCEIEVPSKLYHAFSFSQRRATNAVISNCRRNHSPIFCEREDVTCYNL